MRKLELSKLYNLDKSNSEIIDNIYKIICDFEQIINKPIESSNNSDIDNYMGYLVERNRNDVNIVRLIARHLKILNKRIEYIHLMQYFNSLEVFDQILSRYEDKDKLLRENENVTPSFGTNIDDLPEYTMRLMDLLKKHLPRAACQKVLTGNNHQIPKEAFEKEKQYYEKSTSLKQYLKERHQRKIDELKDYQRRGEVWFEQEATDDLISYVASNQQLLSAIIEDNKMYITKIPYDANKFLNEKNDKLKKYYACHCPFVREAINKDQKIDEDWCYCSAGFAKYPFEIVLGQELPVKLLKSPLKGDMICQFEIDLTNIEYKK